MNPSPENLLQEKCVRLENQVAALKNVCSLRKNLLEHREHQVKDLISKLKTYEVVVAEEQEYRKGINSRLETSESQCAELAARLTKNIKFIEEMKTVYDSKISTLIDQLEISEKRNQQLSDQLNCAQLRISEMTKDLTIAELNKKLDEKDKAIKEMHRQYTRVWDRNKQLSYQMSLLNNLFNETEGVSIDFEKIKAIGDIVRESHSLAEKANNDDILNGSDSNSERRPSVDLENLIDTIDQSETTNSADIPGEESCYKSVDTKGGPQLVLSVSRTFIKLKDLIIEKKSLQKEIETLKTFNTKLESKVDKQEHRLYRVSMELNRTWSLVSKLKQQHKRLYNSEAVLRYELQEKRALLEKLKTELSISREKWRRVRQKNSQSQIELDKLRDEFAQRKHQSSQESGTFSEVMSVSSGENDVTFDEEDEETTTVRSRANSKQLERPKTLQLPFANTSQSHSIRHDTNDRGDEPENVEDDEGPPHDEDYDGACALSPVEDETLDSEDPLEELVSDLVEDIDNEADTEEESSSRMQPEGSESSPSPDFEDRLRRRASRLRMLEEQCLLLHQKLVTSTQRSVALSSKLAVLHDHYGTSGSSTGTPSDEHRPEPVDSSVSDASQTQEEATDATTDDVQLSTDEAVSTSTDAAYISESEHNGATGRVELLPTPEDLATQVIHINDTIGTSHAETSASSGNGLIHSSQNSNISSPNENNSINIPRDAPSAGESQGHSDTEIGSRTSDIVDLNSIGKATQAVLLMHDAPANATTGAALTTVPHPIPVVALHGHQGFVVDESGESDNNESNLVTGDITQEAESRVTNDIEIPRAIHAPNVVEVQGNEGLGDPMPVQEAVVQHFPSTTDEEANEFGSVHIRPEFLRLLQEADEATNAHSLDWMPSLLTITHNIALLRLDPELPSSSTTNSTTEGSASNPPRSYSESLRIEIPPPSPSPPPLQSGNGDRAVLSNDVNERPPENSLTSPRRDPNFLSRIIIQQLPKRLQLLKNENHTLQMEAAESKMRMKEAKRKLSKELEKTQQLAISLDSQIEDKNLIEFELREELEKKEKVIEELQIEVEESKGYVDELKKEKDEMETYFKILLEEKIDLNQPKVPPDTVKDCHNCKRVFTLLSRRKFHCKICGKVYCKDCALYREPNKRSPKRPRLCTRCHLRRQRLTILTSTSKQSTDKLNT